MQLNVLTPEELRALKIVRQMCAVAQKAVSALGQNLTKAFHDLPEAVSMGSSSALLARRQITIGIDLNHGFLQCLLKV